jgi:CO/xanthine dehydrogenase Mo-binding subunit
MNVVMVSSDPNPDWKDLAPRGAGEAGHIPLIAAVANALHDATGVRMHPAPFCKNEGWRH